MARSVDTRISTKRYNPDPVFVTDRADERKTTAVPRRHPPQPKQLDAGPFEAEVVSFRLHLAAEGKAGRTLHTYTEAVRWFAAAHLLRQTDKTRWQQVDRQDLQRWTVWLLGEYSTAYASNQFRAVRRFLRWLAHEEHRPDPTARLRAPKPKPKLVPVFTSEELSALVRHERGEEPFVGIRLSLCAAVQEMKVLWPFGVALRGVASNRLMVH